MCGICGVFQFNGGAADPQVLRAMCLTLKHRGPDDEKIHTAPFIGLGQRRLSIIDLRKEAAPPLSNENQSLWVVCNGEIYNFKELKKDLLGRGHSFKTETDTEVLVHLYEDHGPDCLKQLRGMFAFSIWDARKKQLFAARDRLGKKPFYYYQNEASFVFASEIKAILKFPGISPIPNFSAIDDYLTFQYVPSPQTAFANIFKIPAAHYLVVDAKGSLKVERYWQPDFSKKHSASPEELSLEIQNLLRESVKTRLVSDVPLGAFLSGGIDSSIVVALMAQESAKPIKTFSIGFEEDRFNELPYAREIAEKFGTEHHEFIVKPSAVEILPHLAKHFDEPFADSSAIPTYYLSKLTHQHVTVALSGDGGDESFAGYQHYGNILHWARLDALPLVFRRGMAKGFDFMMDLLPYSNLGARLKRAAQMFGSTLNQRYLLQLSNLKIQEKEMLYTPHFYELISSRGKNHSKIDNLKDSSHLDRLDWMMLHDLVSLLPDCFMVKTDRTSMANSLEVRCPFLDHRMIEFSAAIPSSLKRKGKTGKIILKNSFKDFIPANILKRKKMGFGVPLAKWFRKDSAPFLKSFLLNHISRQRNLFNFSFLEKMITEHIAGRRDWNNRLWLFLCLEMWFREFID